jgi:hypothetical protein
MSRSLLAMFRSTSKIFRVDFFTGSFAGVTV